MIYRKKRIPTVTLERNILHYLVSSKVILQGSFNSCREEWFTCESRFTIFLMIGNNYEKNRNTLTETQFKFELDSLYPDPEESKRKDVEAEYQIIKDNKPDDEVAVVISRLNEALLTADTEDLIMSAYEDIEGGDVEAAISKLKQGTLRLHKREEKNRVVSLWDETEDWIAEVINRKEHPEKYAGIPIGFKKFDDCTGGLFPAELTLIFGLSGKGKSTIMKQIGVNVRKQGYNVLHCGNEEDEFQIRTKYTAVETGVKYSHWKRGKFTEVEMRQYEEYVKEQRENNTGKLFVYNFPQQTDTTMIARQLMELKSQGVKIDLVIVDYLDLMSSIKKAYNENDEGGRVTGDLKQLAIDFHVPVLVCTQAGTQAEKQELREEAFLQASDVFGTKRKVHSANTLMGITNHTATVGAGSRDDSELKLHRLTISVPKNRDGPIFKFRLVIEVETGRVEIDENNDEIGKAMDEHAQQVLNECERMEFEANTKKGQKQIASRLEKRTEELLSRLENEEAEEDSSLQEDDDYEDPFLPKEEPKSEQDSDEAEIINEPEQATELGSILKKLRQKNKKK